MKHSRSSLFLMELIIAILFFSLASAVCIQLFARSHLLSRETVNQNNAITQAQNLAESWYAAGGSLDAMLLMLDGSAPTDGGNGIFTVFDSDWNAVESSDPEVSYVAELSLLPDASGLLYAAVTVYSCADPNSWNLDGHTFSPDTGTMIYSLNLALHNAERRGSLE
ncbi:MAG: hypothetical protein NC432_00015 [Roseburia sp.]|nr:hypothetical protein [Roseburia sp.]MCM1096533.1 hypothetical protein [Ruminococcus flavefaciens]